MNLLEAIQGAGENWIRPVSWSAQGRGFKIKNRKLIYIDHTGYTESTFTSDVFYLLGEWEIVTHEQVLSERKS